MSIQEFMIKFPSVETELLLAHSLKKPAIFLYSNLSCKLGVSQQKWLLSAAKKRLSGYPMAYILGYKYFYGEKFLVNKSVLIPRPETEQLIDITRHMVDSGKWTVDSKRFRIQNSEFRILDLGTGSGCIALSLAKNIASKRVRITASDISAKALLVAKKNSQKLKVKNIKFIKSNLFQNVFGNFDIVVANLPYVPKEDYEKLKANLRYEPKIALTDNSDTWQIYERFFKQVSRHLNPDSVILLEIDPGARKILIGYSKKYLNNYKITFIKDNANRFRFALVYRSSKTILKVSKSSSP